MKQKIEQEEAFFSQVEEVLQSHEDAYEIGAWEEFVATRKKNKRRWPIYIWTAAAAVLLLLGFGLFELSKTNQLQDSKIVVKNQQAQPSLKKDAAAIQKHDQTGISDSPVSDDAVAIASTNKTLITPQTRKNELVVAIESLVNPPMGKVDQLIVAGKGNQQSTNAIASIAVAAKDTTGLVSAFKNVNKNEPVLAGAYDSLVNRNRVASVAEKNNKKLTYSLVVSPSLSNQKVNFGAGMELSYKVGQHLSLSSGLMYTAIGAKSDGNSLVASNNSRAQDANLALRGIEVPLGVQYQTKGGFYASAGVSALGLIKDKLEYSYLTERTISVSDTYAGITNEVLKVVNEKKTEKSIEPLNNYMGFFNFSAGKKQAFGNVNLNIGPFVKVPFSSVSSEKIKLLQGGIKVSIDF